MIEIRRGAWAASLFAVAFLALPASAAQLIQNGSFESGFVPAWVESGALNFTSVFGATSGTQAAVFNPGDQAPNGVLSQAVSTLPGGAYVLEFDFGAWANALAGTEMSLVVEVTGAGVLATLPVSDLASAPTTWDHHTLPFVADSATTLITFRDTSEFTVAVDCLVDSVTLVGPAPVATLPKLLVRAEYATPATVFGPVSFGETSLPATFAATFVFEGLATDANVVADLSDVSSASIRFGDGLWATDLTSFSLVTSASGEVTTLSYETGPLTTPTAVARPILNSSFSATITGTDIASGLDFEYFYAESEQTLVVHEVPGVPALDGGALGLLAGLLIAAGAALARTHRTSNGRDRRRVERDTDRLSPSRTASSF